MSKKVLIVALIVGAVFMFRDKLSFNSDGSSGNDQRSVAAVSLTGGVLSKSAPPTPNPTPPDDKYPRKDCPYCKGTGYIVHGDGHRTPCTHCYVAMGTLKKWVLHYWDNKQYTKALKIVNQMDVILNNMPQDHAKTLEWREDIQRARRNLATKLYVMDREKYDKFRSQYDDFRLNYQTKRVQPQETIIYDQSWSYGGSCGAGCTSCGGGGGW